MSLSQALNTASSGLRVTQAGLSLIASNVANAQTPGYVRKTQDVITASEDTGGSVRVGAVNRELDQYLRAKMPPGGGTRLTWQQMRQSRKFSLKGGSLAGMSPSSGQGGGMPSGYSVPGNNPTPVFGAEPAMAGAPGGQKSGSRPGQGSGDGTGPGGGAPAAQSGQAQVLKGLNPADRESAATPGELGAEEPLAEWELAVLEGKASDDAAAQTPGAPADQANGTTPDQANGTAADQANGEIVAERDDATVDDPVDLVDRESGGTGEACRCGNGIVSGETPAGGGQRLARWRHREKGHTRRLLGGIGRRRLRAAATKSESNDQTCPNVPFHMSPFKSAPPTPATIS